jgi:hypothetical protein
MNGIALVELETSSPLFVDPYDRSRATGSFILIDALSNATVGAGMIRETHIAAQAIPDVDESLRAKTDRSGVGVQERYARHGHRAGIFLLPESGLLAQSTERALFNVGFETVLLRANELRSSSLTTLVQALWSLGSVILVVVDGDSSQIRIAMESFKSESFFDYSAASKDSESSDLVTEIVLSAETLRLESTPRNAEKEN